MVKPVLSKHPDFPYAVTITNDPTSHVHYIAVFSTISHMMIWMKNGAYMSEVTMNHGCNLPTLSGTYYCDKVNVVADRVIYTREYDKPQFHLKYALRYKAWALIESD